jgi:5-methyltetrahydropteroyltriglutamate--homocysteine methyltransferase
MSVVGKLRRLHGIQLRDFEYLDAVTGKVAKVSIPSPSMLHFRGGQAAIDAEAYPDMEGIFAELADVYNQEILALGAMGCT